MKRTAVDMEDNSGKIKNVTSLEIGQENQVSAFVYVQETTLEYAYLARCRRGSNSGNSSILLQNSRYAEYEKENIKKYYYFIIFFKMKN